MPATRTAADTASPLAVRSFAPPPPSPPRRRTLPPSVPARDHVRPSRTRRRRPPPQLDQGRPGPRLHFLGPALALGPVVPVRPAPVDQPDPGQQHPRRRPPGREGRRRLDRRRHLAPARRPLVVRHRARRRRRPVDRRRARRRARGQGRRRAHGRRAGDPPRELGAERVLRHRPRERQEPVPAPGRAHPPPRAQRQRGRRGRRGQGRDSVVHHDERADAQADRGVLRGARLLWPPQGQRRLLRAGCVPLSLSRSRARSEERR